VRKVLTSFAVVVLALVVVVAVLLGHVLLNQGSLVYFPDRHVRFTPRDLGMAFEDVRLTASDGVSLAAWFVPAPHSRGVLIFCHGNAGNMGDRVAKLRLLNDLGLSVLAFDYRGYGQSQGKPSEEGIARDMDAAIAHVLESRAIPLERIVFYGESLGGAVAVAAAARHRPAALVLESTFTSARDMAHHHYPFLPSFLVRIGYDALACIRTLSCPKLILHSPQDRIVPFDMGRTLYDAAPEPKYFANLVGDHNSGGIVESREAFDALTAFLDAFVPLAPGLPRKERQRDP
jgi:fermentation-respiration switch protein FrsA (DUF1100 family)